MLLPITLADNLGGLLVGFDCCKDLVPVMKGLPHLVHEGFCDDALYKLINLFL